MKTNPVNWTKNKPTVPGYYHVINDKSPEPFIRWVVPGDNDHLDEWYAAIGTPEPPREPAKIETAATVIGVSGDCITIDYCCDHYVGRTFVHTDDARKFTIGSCVRITVEEMP